ncbi:MAG: class I SAM-dependent methyltransferase [Acidimicrobiales bacterium]
MDVLRHNREAWDHEVDTKNMWTVPVTRRQVERARQGDWSVLVTTRLAVPREWFPDLRGAAVLCLASGGGQQGPLLAAAGARVTVFDTSPRQLEQDRKVAERDELDIETVQGDMADLSAFEDERFDLILNPCSNCFAESVRPVWQECFRVLRPGGILIAGFAEPLLFCFDKEKELQGVLEVRYPVPYSDVTSITAKERAKYLEPDEPLCFGHSLADQIGGQLDAGFLLTGLYEDYHLDGDVTVDYFPAFLGTRAVKPA